MRSLEQQQPNNNVLLSIHSVGVSWNNLYRKLIFLSLRDLHLDTQDAQRYHCHILGYKATIIPFEFWKKLNRKCKPLFLPIQRMCLSLTKAPFIVHSSLSLGRCGVLTFLKFCSSFGEGTPCTFSKRDVGCSIPIFGPIALIKER